jgi:hypothetical protein
MAKKQMVNFRAPQESVDMYDRAADESGMTRSEWLRNAAELALGSHRDKGFTPKANVISVTPGPQCVEGNFRGCEAADWRKLPSGIKVCGTCGIRTK